MPDANFVSPQSIAQRSDVAKLVRELAIIDEYLNQLTIKGLKEPPSLKVSPKLNQLVTVNKINLLNRDQRTETTKWLETVARGPVVNISFSSEAGEDFLSKIIAWLRQEIDPYCLIVVGLSPSIGLGSLVRTTNKVFDLSLRSRLKGHQQQLLQELKGIE